MVHKKSETAYRRVFVYYPRGIRTGGPEALHQLVSSMRQLGIEAFLVPQPGTEDSPRAKEYAHYDAPELPIIDDSEGHAIVASEYAYRLLREVKKAERFVWWLSIDNSPLFIGERRLVDQNFLGTLTSAKLRYETAKVAVRRLRSRFRGDYKLLQQCRHLTQSAYAAAFLYSRLNIVSSMLSDFTNPLESKPITSAVDRGRTIAYNPKKAAAITARLAEAYPAGTFVPLANMSRHEVLATLSTSAVYLDLGTHPGKDRMPREAVLSGCVTLVARRGSGAFDLDVPVPAHHKLPTIHNPVDEAVALLDNVFDDIHRFLGEQSNYRAIVENEHSTFLSEISGTFFAVPGS